VIVMPARMPATGGFTGAGAIRTPLTLPGPTAPQPVKVSPAQPRTAKKPVAIHKPASGGASQTDKTAAEAGAPH
jgi:hypothetical protein